jgi:hypothetical protein
MAAKILAVHGKGKMMGAEQSGDTIEYPVVEQNRAEHPLFGPRIVRQYRLDKLILIRDEPQWCRWRNASVVAHGAPSP